MYVYMYDVDLQLSLRMPMNTVTNVSTKYCAVK